MSNNDRRNDWSLIAAIALIALGVWFLLGNVFGPEWTALIKQAFRIVWPVGLIILGVLLYLGTSSTAARNGSGKRLYRARDDRMIAGVLAGVSRYIGADPTLIRVLYVLFGLITGIGPAILFYVIATFVIPEEPAGSGVQAPVWPQTQPPVTPPTDSGSWGGGSWPHTGTETVQTPAPSADDDSAPEPPPAAEGPAKS